MTDCVLCESGAGGSHTRRGCVYSWSDIILMENWTASQSTTNVGPGLSWQYDIMCSLCSPVEKGPKASQDKCTSGVAQLFFLMIMNMKKPTDRNQYLLISSCHPAHVTNNIPFSLALRIVRICSLPEDREKRFGELEKMLLDRNYKLKIVQAAIEMRLKYHPLHSGKW